MIIISIIGVFIFFLLILLSITIHKYINKNSSGILKNIYNINSIIEWFKFLSLIISFIIFILFILLFTRKNNIPKNNKQ